MAVFRCLVTASLLLYVVAKIHEDKPIQATHLCGRDFVNTWIRVCKVKLMRENSNRKRRSIDDLWRTKNVLLEPQKAKTFLHPLSRNKREIPIDNATEECCRERCTVSEIWEYKC